MLKSLITDERGSISSKRLMGIICTLVLCVVALITTFNAQELGPPEYIIDAIALLAFGCLGLTSIDKFTRKDKSRGSQDFDSDVSGRTTGED